MREELKNLIQAQGYLESCEAELRKLVVAKIKKDYNGYELPDSARIEIKPSGMVYVTWQDLSAIHYGLDIDEDDFVDLYLDPDEL